MVKQFMYKEGRRDNSHIGMKVALRLKLLEYFDNPTVLDVYGGFGAMHRHVWQKYNYVATEEDALQWLQNNDLRYEIYDVDPYGSPYEALKLINEKISKEKFAIACTDGALRRQALMRSPTIPKIVIDLLHDMDFTNKRTRPYIYYNYPVVLRLLISRIFPNYEIKKLYLKYGNRNIWASATCYFSCLLSRNRVQ